MLFENTFAIDFSISETKGVPIFGFIMETGETNFPSDFISTFLQDREINLSAPTRVSIDIPLETGFPEGILRRYPCRECRNVHLPLGYLMPCFLL